MQNNSILISYPCDSFDNAVLQDLGIDQRENDQISHTSHYVTYQIRGIKSYGNISRITLKMSQSSSSSEYDAMELNTLVKADVTCHSIL
jgi:hypothetical protein